MSTPLLVLLLLLLLLLSQSRSIASLRLAVVTECRSLSESSGQNRAVERIINNNWRFATFKTNPIEFLELPVADSIHAVMKVCRSPGLSGIVVVGSCQFVSDVLKVSSSLNIPAVAVIRGLCLLSSTPDTAVVSTPPARSFLGAVTAALDHVSSTLVAVFHDRHQDHRLLEELQQLLSEKRIASVMFQIDDSASNLTHILQNSVKARIRHSVVICEPDSIPRIFEQALMTRTLQINYFWTVVDTGIAPKDIEDLIPANESANILFLRQSAGELGGMDCTGELGVIYPDCQLSQHTMLELKVVEAVLSFARAMQTLMSSSSLPASNASCEPLQPWPAGSALARQLNQLWPRSTNTSIQPSSSDFLETLGLLNNGLNSNAHFVPSSKFNVINSSLSVIFAYKERPLLFPNTFLDFKGARLRVCAPPFPPYTTYANYTFGKPSGHSVDMLNFFTKHLDFSYDLFSPPDVQFGAPVEGSPYFTGCIGMLQKGEADFAMIFAVTNIRYKVIDYADEYQFSSNTILVKLPPAESKLWNVFTPLSWDSWLLILCMFLLVPVIIFAFAWLSPFSAWNLGLPYAFADEVWLKEYIWSAVGSFLQQGQDFYPFAMSPRTVMAFWWMLTVVIFGAYTGDLTAKLAVTVAKYPIESVEDLVALPHYKAMVAEGTNIYASIKLATDGPMAMLRRQMVLVDTMTTCAETLLKPDADPYLVCISDQSSNSYYASAFCSQVYQANKFFNFYYLAMTFPKDAYYLPAFNFLLERGKESGIVDMVTRKFIPQTNDCGGSSAAAEAAAITLEGVGGAYIISLGLYLCGAIILFAELLWVLKLQRSPLDLPGY